ncbi:MAG: hypothetical protein ACOCXM_00245 [Myxococcota bacterium]
MAPKKTTKGGKAAAGSGSRKKAASGEQTAAKKSSARTSSEKKTRPKKEAPAEPGGSTSGKKRTAGAAAIAEAIIEDPQPGPRVAEWGEQLLDTRSTTATQAARVLHETVTRKPELVVGLVDRFVKGLRSKNKRVVQTSADALPAIAKVSPARVARHLDVLTTSFDAVSDTGKDGLVRTFANLCSASVAYQKRLEPVLTKALGQAEGKTLLAWTESVLPALKGEPHARARAVVESRLHKIPRSVAQPIADLLGVKLRPNVR